jgi:signal transduction histidine kinase
VLDPVLAADADLRPVPVSLADTINHEFRNPLATLLGHLEMVREREDLPADVLVSLEAMHRAGEKISHLVTAAADIAEVTSATL